MSDAFTAALSRKDYVNSADNDNQSIKDEFNELYNNNNDKADDNFETKSDPPVIDNDDEKSDVGQTDKQENALNMGKTDDEDEHFFENKNKDNQEKSNKSDLKSLTTNELRQEFINSEEVIKYMINTFKVKEDDLIYANKIGKVISIIELVYERMSEEYASTVDWDKSEIELLDKEIEENERKINEIRKSECTTSGNDKELGNTFGRNEENQYRISGEEVKTRASNICRTLADRKSAIDNNLKVDAITSNKSLFKMLKDMMGYKFKEKNFKHVITQGEQAAKDNFYQLLQESSISDEEMKAIEDALDMGLSYEELATLIGKDAEKIKVLSRIIKKGKLKSE